MQEAGTGRRHLAAWHLVAVMCAVETLGMAGFATFATLLPEFTRLWGLSGTDAGWISSAYFVGYVAGVPLLVGATDRHDARAVYLFGLALTGAGNVAFALWAHGLWSAVGLRMMAGFGLAGMYMPGLRVLSTRLIGAARVRAVPWYTGFFSVGTSLSFLATAQIRHWFDWHASFLYAGGCAVLGAVLVVVLIAPQPAPSVVRSPVAFSGLRRVLRSPRLLGWSLMYGGHTWELMALRAWMVAFLTFAAAHGPSGAAAWNPGLIAGIVVLFGMPASVFTAEIALARDRLKVVRTVMLTSAVLAVLFGLSARWPFPVVIALAFAYNTLVMADSGSITAGAVAESQGVQEGAMLTVYTLTGFSGGMAGPLVVGAILDWSGGADRPGAWVAAMAAAGLGSVLAWLATRLTAKQPGQAAP